MRRGRIIVHERAGGRKFAALVVDGRLEDLLIGRTNAEDPAPGAIYHARVLRCLAASGGAFVDLGSGGPGYLRTASGAGAGDSLAVQVKTLPEPGKAPVVTTRLAIRSRFAIVTPGKPGIGFSAKLAWSQKRRRRLRALAEERLGDSLDRFGVIFRTACDHAEFEAIGGDLACTLDLAEQALARSPTGEPGLRLPAPDADALARTEWSASEPDDVLDCAGSFETLGIWDMISALRQPIVELPADSPGTRQGASGATLVIEPTRALVAVDVNTGDRFSKDAGKLANLEAARELPRQLRLRGLGGQVVIDFAPMPGRQRQEIERMLESAFRADPVDTTLAGWTPLGNFELRRMRARIPLASVAIDQLPTTT